MYREEEFSRLEISLQACLENYRYFRDKLQDTTKLLVLVKANAYGHGAVEFASLMEDAGADYLAVAYPVEGIELRQGGFTSNKCICSGVIPLPGISLPNRSILFDDVIYRSKVIRTFPTG